MPLSYRFEPQAYSLFLFFPSSKHSVSIDYSPKIVQIPDSLGDSLLEIWSPLHHLYILIRILPPFSVMGQKDSYLCSQNILSTIIARICMAQIICYFKERGFNMAQRSVFIPKAVYPYYEEILVNLDWFGGYALSQRRKNELGLHLNFNYAYPDLRFLEVSSASLCQIGQSLSAMNLSKRTSQGCTCVESAFQSSRIYYDGGVQIGPFPEYLFLPGRRSKKLVKIASEGHHSFEYSFEGKHFFTPNFHPSLFYDFIYISALLEDENKQVTSQLLSEEYSAFSDLATKSLNTQARSCAIFVGLHKAGKLEMARSVQSFLELFRVREKWDSFSVACYDNYSKCIPTNQMTLSPIVPSIFSRSDVEQEYNRQYAHLSNSKK